MKTAVKLHQIERARAEVTQVQRLYLQRFGWKETSETPGSYWLWARDFADVDAERRAWHDAHPKASKMRPYGVVTAPIEIAVMMTARVLDKDGEGEER